LTNPSYGATLKMVLNRGPVPFQGGLTSRLSLLPAMLTGVVH
jgi:hypothetical protein